MPRIVQAKLTEVLKTQAEPSNKQARTDTPDTLAKMSNELGPQNAALLTAFSAILDEKLDNKIHSVNAAMVTLAEACDDGLESLAKQMETETLKRETMCQEIRQEVAQMKKSVQTEERKSQAASSTSTPVPVTPQAMPSVFKSTPSCIVYFGNLGWDSPGEVLIQRCRKSLQRYGIEKSESVEVTPITNARKDRDAGSAAFAHLPSVNDADFVITRSKYVRVTFAKKPVYVQFKRSDEQLSMLNSVRRLAKCLAELEPLGDEFEYKAVGIRVTAGSSNICYRSQNKITWTAFGLEKVKAENRGIAEAFALA